MNIRTDKFRSKLELLKPAVPKNPTLKLLVNACVINGKLAATDLEERVILNLPEAGEEAFLIPYAAVTEVLKYVPGDKILTVESKEKGVKLVWSGGAASYLTPDVHEYPDLTIKDEPVAEGMLNGDKLLSAFLAAMPYCATETARPVLNGIHLYLGDVLQVAGADGFRVSFQSINMSYPWRGVIILPQETVKTLDLLWRKSPPRPAQHESLVGNLVGVREFKLSLFKSAIKIEFGEITLYSRLIEGTPPDVLNLLNGFKEPSKVRLMAPELWYAVRKVEGAARAGSGIVKLQWTESKMTVSAGSEEKGEVSSEFPVEVGSAPGRIALNVKYILDYVVGKEGLITIGVSGPSAPAVFHYGAKPIVAVMPMFVEWADVQKKEAERTEDIKEEVAIESAEKAGESGESGESGAETGEVPEKEYAEGVLPEGEQEESEPVTAIPKKPRRGRCKKTE